MIDILFRSSEYSDHLAFKGGTSLSKCYDVIERFSEDIDLILDWRVIGLRLNEPWEERSKNKQDIFNKSTNEKTAIFLREKFLKSLQEDLANEKVEGWSLFINQDDPFTIHFSYPRSFQNPALVQEIRLELGCLASWTPTKELEIIPYAANYYPQLFTTNSTSVRTVEAKRTFWEKATILHREAHRPITSNLPARYSRHYYDLYMMLHSPIKESAIADPELLKEVAEFKEKFYICNWTKYGECTFNDILLSPPDSIKKTLMTDYSSMQSMIYGQQIPFEEILQGIAAFEKELRKFGE